MSTIRKKLTSKKFNQRLLYQHFQAFFVYLFCISTPLLDIGGKRKVDAKNAPTFKQPKPGFYASHNPALTVKYDF